MLHFLSLHLFCIPVSVCLFVVFCLFMRFGTKGKRTHLSPGVAVAGVAVKGKALVINNIRLDFLHLGLHLTTCLALKETRMQKPLYRVLKILVQRGQ